MGFTGSIGGAIFTGSTMGGGSSDGSACGGRFSCTGSGLEGGLGRLLGGSCTRLTMTGGVISFSGLEKGANNAIANISKWIAIEPSRD
ncbi:hypothetical protein [Candidatus Magnetaquicoccus inordinatus]|uniref:hypothetical protein n=1 Tax=Candidatus Magnetaquicoccus inordinatus TaxID=2496818 RepID=UPI00102B0BF8|nr:hypothetical protein [Candidatus Magnetaquicoccus inordinatus]